MAVTSWRWVSVRVFQWSTTYAHNTSPSRQTFRLQFRSTPCSCSSSTDACAHGECVFPASRPRKHQINQSFPLWANTSRTTCFSYSAKSPSPATTIRTGKTNATAVMHSTQHRAHRSSMYGGSNQSPDTKLKPCPARTAFARLFSSPSPFAHSLRQNTRTSSRFPVPAPATNTRFFPWSNV